MAVRKNRNRFFVQEEECPINAHVDVGIGEGFSEDNFVKFLSNYKNVMNCYSMFDQVEYRVMLTFKKVDELYNFVGILSSNVPGITQVRPGVFGRKIL